MLPSWIGKNVWIIGMFALGMGLLSCGGGGGGGDKGNGSQPPPLQPDVVSVTWKGGADESCTVNAEVSVGGKSVTMKADEDGKADQQWSIQVDTDPGAATLYEIKAADAAGNELLQSGSLEQQ